MGENKKIEENNTENETEIENKMYIVNNIDLDTAVREVESIVIDKNIKINQSRERFIENLKIDLTQSEEDNNNKLSLNNNIIEKEVEIDEGPEL